MNQEIWDQRTVWQKYREALEGRVSKTDLIESNRARLLKYAIDERNKALKFINELLAVNPGATFDYLAGSSVNYQNAISVINWLSDETPKQAQPVKPQIEAKQEVAAVLNKQILFTDPLKIFEVLKPYFPDSESDLLKVLKGEKIETPIIYPHNQNQIAEFFRRVKYNNHTLNNDTEIKDWLCSTFHFKDKRNNSVRPLNKKTVWDIVNKGKGEATKTRICKNIEWLKHQTPSLVQKGKNK
jgi:hypothetical protein